MARSRTITKPRKPFRIEAKFLNWVLTQLPKEDDHLTDDEDYKSAPVVIHSDCTDSGPEDTTCECGVKLGEGQSVKINSVLDAAKSWEFRNSTRVIRLKFDKTLITEPQWTSSARFHAETNQSVVLLHCKGDACDNKFVWLQSTPGDVYYFTPQ